MQFVSQNLHLALGLLFPLTKKIPLAKKNPLTCASDTEKKFH